MVRHARNGKHAAPKPAPDRIVLKVRTELGGRVFERDLAIDAIVETDPEGLNRALAEIPTLFATYVAAEAQARADAKEAEIARAKLHADLFLHYESTQTRTDAKGHRAKPTVDTIKSLIAKDPRYIAEQHAVVEAEHQLDQMIGARQTIQQKKDVQLAVASNYRAELDAGARDTVKFRTVRERFAAARSGGADVH